MCLDIVDDTTTIAGMDLARYFKEKKMPVAEFAAIVGVHRTQMYKFKNGDRRPSLDVAIRIEEATDGLVPVESFREQ